MKAKSEKSKFRFKSSFSIGGVAAETDPFLEACFLATDCYTLVADVSNPKCAIIGRSGTGKTAIISELSKAKAEHCIRIQPEALAFQFLGKSQMIRALKTGGINLDYFYKLLWRHVLVTEILKYCFPTEAKRAGLLSQLVDSLQTKMRPDPERKRAMNYLDQWDAQLVQTPQERIKEIHDNLSKRLSAKFGFSLPWQDIFKVETGLDGQITNDKNVTERVTLANEVISQIQVQDLNSVLDYIRTKILDDRQKPLYVLIDDLDRFWVDDHIVYDLLKGLILEIYEWRKVKNLKIVYVLRNNIVNKIEQDFSTRSYQKEKLEDQRYYLRWTKQELINVVNKRLERICVDSNFTDRPILSDILPKRTKRDVSGVDYVLERTMDRPRDIIDFINRAGALCVAKSNISARSLRDAEQAYSLGRLQALYDEWRENYPGLEVFTRLVRNHSPRFPLSSWADNDIMDVLTDPEIAKYKWIAEMCGECQRDYQKNQVNAMHKCRRRFLKLLFEVGIVGVRLSPGATCRYCHAGEPLLSDAEIEDDPEITIHPMLHRALGILTADRANIAQ